jgi:uncharacterized protein (DUF1501 family)
MGSDFGCERRDGAMLTLGNGMAKTCSGPTRRDFLRVGGLGALGLTLAETDIARAAGAGADRAVILLLLVGGPSQLETFDPKPSAPSEIRGPFRAIETNVPGIRLGEHLPRLAQRMNQVALLRTLHHDAAPIHETGQQLLQTGRLSRPGEESPHAGSVAAKILGIKGDLPPFVIVPGPIANTGVGVSHGQSAGTLGPAFDPFHLNANPAAPDYDAHAALDRACRFLDSSTERSAAATSVADRLLNRRTRSAFDLSKELGAVRDSYGRDTFGQSCLLARRLVESGVRMVTVNMFETVFHKVTWDCHGSAPFSNLADYASELLPTFDRAYCALLDDLSRRGLLESTLVVATGEFGRTPRLNPSGGRDHWPSVWSGLVAGGGTRGGQAIGSSDSMGGEPVDRPVAPAELVATVYRSLGIDPSRRLNTDAGSLALVDEARPIGELFA